MKKCEHHHAISIWHPVSGLESRRLCSDCNETLSLGWSNDSIDVIAEMEAARLVSEYEDGCGLCLGYSQNAGWCDSPDEHRGAGWWSGWLARAIVDHDQILAQLDLRLEERGAESRDDLLDRAVANDDGAVDEFMALTDAGVES